MWLMYLHLQCFVWWRVWATCHGGMWCVSELSTVCVTFTQSICECARGWGCARPGIGTGAKNLMKEVSRALSGSTSGCDWRKRKGEFHRGARQMQGCLPPHSKDILVSLSWCLTRRRKIMSKSANGRICWANTQHWQTQVHNDAVGRAAAFLLCWCAATPTTVEVRVDT